jgi:ribosomal protein S18 acetylase RimI-like enzyme
MNIISIQKPDAELIAQVAKIHSLAYSSEHFSSGFNFEKLVEYNSSLIEASSLTIFALDDNVVLGYIISGFDFSSGIKDFIGKNRFWLMFMMLKSPFNLVKRILIYFLSKFNIQKPSAAKYRLLSIATLPSYQSSGVGRSMLEFLERELSMKDVNLYGLSVKDSNIAAIRFYERNGFLKEKSNMGTSYYIKRMVKE